MPLDPIFHADNPDRIGGGSGSRPNPRASQPLSPFAANTARLDPSFSPSVSSPQIGLDGLKRRILGQIPGYGQTQPGIASSVGNTVQPNVAVGPSWNPYNPWTGGQSGSGSMTPGGGGQVLPGEGNAINPSAIPNPNPGSTGPPGDGPHTLQDALQQLIGAHGGPNTYGNLLSMLFGGGQLPGTIFSMAGPNADFVRQQATQTADALNGRNALMSHAYGLDKSQSGYGAYQSALNGQGSVAGAVNDTLGQNAAQYSEMLRQLFAGAMGYNYDRGISDQNFIHSKYGQQSGNIGDIIAQLIGSAGGALLGGKH